MKIMSTLPIDTFSIPFSSVAMFNKAHRGDTLIRAFRVTVLAILILVDIACAAPFAYVTNMGDYHNDTNYNPNVAVYNPNVALIDIATNNVTARVPLGGGWPVGVAVNPAGTKVYVVDSPMDVSTVYVIDTATSTVSAKVNIGSSYP